MLLKKLGRGLGQAGAGLCRRWGKDSLVLSCCGTVLAVTGVLALLLNLPLITMAQEVREPYYVTETVQQPCSRTEYAVRETAVRREQVIAEGYYTVVPAGVSVKFCVDRPGARLSADFENTIPGSFIIYNSAGHIVFEKRGSRGSLDLALPPGSYTARFQENVMWGEDVYIRLALTWNEMQRDVAAQEVAASCPVPVQVSRERTVLKEAKYSLWQLITGFYASDESN